MMYLKNRDIKYGETFHNKTNCLSLVNFNDLTDILAIPCFVAR